MSNMEERCNLCPRRCNLFRYANHGNGFCKEGIFPRISKACLHFGEEPCISGKNGSGTIFFSGCTLKCVYCQNFDISTKSLGDIYSFNDLAAIFKGLEDAGAHNINLVNPTHFAYAIIESLKIYKPSIPIIYNSSGYENVDTIRKLCGFIDVYLPDIKYSDDKKALVYSSINDYFSNAQKAVTEMVNQVGKPTFDKDNMIQSGVIIRHLVLPSSTENSIGVLRWISDNLKDNVLVSLMAQYTPCGRVMDYPEINRYITRREYNKVEKFLLCSDLNGFLQELSSVGSAYIPDFNDNGIIKNLDFKEDI